nr:protein CEBPZOS [Pogona vitticeps]
MRLTSPRNIIKGIIIVEGFGLWAAYLLYFNMDKSQDFREKMKRRFPFILEVYYKSNEWAGIYGKREEDKEMWLQTKKYNFSPCKNTFTIENSNGTTKKESVI